MTRAFLMLVSLLLLASCALPTGSSLPAATTISSAQATPPVRPPEATAQAASTALTPCLVAASPGPAATSAAQGAPSRAGWKTYISPQWHIAVDYPPDWSIQETDAGALFTSPQGMQIQFQPVDTGGLTSEQYLGNASDIPNTRCSLKTNEHGITTRLCFDTIARSYLATFTIKIPAGQEHLLSLTAFGKPPSAQVLGTMLTSLRPAAS